MGYLWPCSLNLGVTRLDAHLPKWPVTRTQLSVVCKALRTLRLWVTCNMHMRYLWTLLPGSSNISKLIWSKITLGSFGDNDHVATTLKQMEKSQGPLIAFSLTWENIGGKTSNSYSSLESLFIFSNFPYIFLSVVSSLFLTEILTFWILNIFFWKFHFRHCTIHANPNNYSYPKKRVILKRNQVKVTA